MISNNKMVKKEHVELQTLDINKIVTLQCQTADNYYKLLRKKKSLLKSNLATVQKILPYAALLKAIYCQNDRLIIVTSRQLLLLLLYILKNNSGLHYNTLLNITVSDTVNKFFRFLTIYNIASSQSGAKLEV
jgi:hypothetical protein